MAPRVKKLIGLAILIPGLALYLLAAAALGERVPDVVILKVFYYLVAGVAWVFPTRLLIGWTDTESKEKEL